MNNTDISINILIGIFVIIIATFPFSMKIIMKFGIKILDKL